MAEQVLLWPIWTPQFTLVPSEILYGLPKSYTTDLYNIQNPVTELTSNESANFHLQIGTATKQVRGWFVEYLPMELLLGANVLHAFGISITYQRGQPRVEIDGHSVSARLATPVVSACDSNSRQQ